MWEHPTLKPDLHFDTLTGLADWLDAHPDFATPGNGRRCA
jgi:putative hydrolase of the HAD superfamily